MKYKNYYKILGLPNAKVTDNEIKTAYRHLAKLYHPDLNGGDESVSDKFKDVNEAYQILGNEASRKKYDRVYFAYRFRDGIKSVNSSDKINTQTGVNDFITMFFGNKKEKEVVTNFDKYNKSDMKIDGEDLESELDITLEEAFLGTERKIAFKTIENKTKTIKVKIPQGIKSGEKVRLVGQGKPGKNGGKDGNLFIKINILPHKIYRVEGIDLVMDLPLSPWEAALGCEIDITGIDSNIYLNIPAGVQTGERLRVANNGFVDKNGVRGDLLLIAQIMVPKRLTDKEKELFYKFKEFSTFNPRNN